jgi:hypothetical protein
VPGIQCKSDSQCAVPLICKLCPDGSCANPNVHCVAGQCSAPNYTCAAPATDAGPQCKTAADCPVTDICKLCPDGSCASPNVDCVNGQCSAPNYTCADSSDAGPQCKSDADCPVLLICKLCPDGSCANPNVHCSDGACTAPNYTCPPPAGGMACASSTQCGKGEHCTVEDGVCNPPPGCTPPRLCPALCYGTCAADTPCSAEEQALKDFVGANKACKTTDDCEVLSAGCGLSFEDGCTGGVYVNQSTDAATFDKLAGAYAKCKGTSCATCKRLTLPPTCIDGMCQRQSP